MRRALLTGARGFLGRACVPALAARGFEVHAVTRDAPPADSEGVVWHRADLLAPGAAEALAAAARPSHLLHVAWIAEPATYREATENLAWVGASLDLFRACRAAGAGRLVGAGSCFEYEWGAPRLSEAETPLVPSTLYGACKKATGEVLLAFAREAGASAAWGRVFLLYGPGERPGRLVSAVARSLLAGEPVETTSGEQVRDYLHVADAADALAALLDAPVEGAVNVASGVGVPVRAMVDAIAAEAGRPDLVRRGARPTPPGEPAALVADVERLAGEVGWSPRFDLAAGAADTVAWWRARVAPA